MVQTALIGLGYWGPNLLRNFIAQPGCTIRYACDQQDARIAKMQSLYPAVTYTKNAQDIFADPAVELVLIATPTSSHFALAKAALEAGKHVFIEKPMTGTLAEAEELVALAKKQQKHIFVDHTFVFAPAVEKLRTLATDGSLGDLLYFDSSRINLGLIQKDTNVIHDLAIHDLSILATFIDLKTITRVTAHGSKHFGQQEEHAHLHLETDNGFHAHIHVSWLSPVKMRRSVLAGSKGMAVYDDTQPSEKIRVYDSGIDHDTSKPDPFFPIYRAGDVVIPALPNTETLAIEAAHVLDCVAKGTTPKVSGEDGLNMLKILDAADRSLAQKTTVTL